jgi:hypothetical protein
MDGRVGHGLLVNSTGLSLFLVIASFSFACSASTRLRVCPQIIRIQHEILVINGKSVLFVCSVSCLML